MPRMLQLAFRFLPGPVLAPVSAIESLAGFEDHFGKTFAALARHDLVAAFRHFVQAGCPAVQSETDRIQDSRLSRARGPGDSKYAVGRILRLGKIDIPFSGE